MSTPAGPGGFPGQQNPQQGGQFGGQPSPQQPGQDPAYGGGTATYPPQGGAYPAGGQGGGGQGGPGVGERVSHVTDRVAHHVKTPETKEFFKTSEFFVWALTVIGILIAAATVSEGNGHDFPANQAWLYVTIASFAYIISRGISKAGTRRGYGDAPFDRGDGGGGSPFQRGGGY